MLAVIDTNVIIVANGRDSPHASLQCVRACRDYLESVRESGAIVIDDAHLIINEYKNKVSPTGQPGVGDAFFKWLLTNLANPNRCCQVHIHQLSANNFREFPNDPALASFDPSDHKFVAVAITHPAKPSIYNAVDSDWVAAKEALAHHGITIEFLCPEQFSYSKSQ